MVSNKTTKEDDARMMYELSKLTNTSKQITNDFLESVLLYLFREYVACHPEKELFLSEFMEQWEESILQQKQIEIEALTSQYKTMSDLAFGAYIANSENLDSFKREVELIKIILTSALMRGNDE